MVDEPKSSQQSAKLQFHYIKGPQYREIPCHGALGGETSQGGIWMALYTERPPIPRIVEWDVPKPTHGDTIEFNEKTAGPPTRIETKHGIIRHIEVTVHMDLDMAKRLQDWLGKHIAILEKSKASVQ